VHGHRWPSVTLNENEWTFLEYIAQYHHAQFLCVSWTSGYILQYLNCCVGVVVAHDVDNVCPSLYKVQGNERSIRPVLRNLWRSINCTFENRSPVCAVAVYIICIFVRYALCLSVTVRYVHKHSEEYDASKSKVSPVKFLKFSWKLVQSESAFKITFMKDVCLGI